VYIFSTYFLFVPNQKFYRHSPLRSMGLDIALTNSFFGVAVNFVHQKVG